VRKPSEKELVEIRKAFEQFELMSVDLGRLKLECVCEYSIKTREGFYLTHVAFMHAEDSQSCERTIFTRQPIIIDDQRVIEEKQGAAVGLVGGRDLDVLRKGKEYFAASAALDDGPQKTDFGIKQLEDMEYFDPFAATISDAPMIVGGASRSLPSTLYQIEKASGIAELDEFRIYVFRTPGSYPTTCRFVFCDGVPVMLNSMTYADRKWLPIGLTMTTWKSVGDKKVPVQIKVTRPANLGSEYELMAKVNWKFGKEVRDDLFDQKTLGKIGFGEE
jgi:hypothetical protein